MNTISIVLIVAASVGAVAYLVILGYAFYKYWYATIETSETYYTWFWTLLANGLIGLVMALIFMASMSMKMIKA